MLMYKKILLQIILVTIFKVNADSLKTVHHLVSLDGGYVSVHMKDDVASFLVYEANCYEIGGSYLIGWKRHEFGIAGSWTKGRMHSNKSNGWYEDGVFGKVRLNLEWKMNVLDLFNNKVKVLTGNHIQMDLFARGYAFNMDVPSPNNFYYCFSLYLHPDVFVDLYAEISKRQNIEILATLSPFAYSFEFGSQQMGMSKEFIKSGFISSRINLKYTFKPFSLLSFFIAYQFDYLSSENDKSLKIASDAVISGLQLQFLPR